MEDKQKRTKRPRRVLVLEKADGLSKAWVQVFPSEAGGPTPKNASEAQAWVNAGRYGEGVFWVLSTQEEPTTVERVEQPTYTYQVKKGGD